MLTPSKLDPNYEAEIKRRELDPLSFGMPSTPPVAPQAMKPETITLKKGA